MNIVSKQSSNPTDGGTHGNDVEKNVVIFANSQDLLPAMEVCEIYPTYFLVMAFCNGIDKNLNGHGEMSIGRAPKLSQGKIRDYFTVVLCSYTLICIN